MALRREVGGLLYLCAGLPPRNEAEHLANLEAFRSLDPPAYDWDDRERMSMSREDATLDCARYRALFQDRIGVTPAELPGGHSPFLSRPAALARLMHAMTQGSDRT
jgi:hypothetical protein